MKLKVSIIVESNKKLKHEAIADIQKIFKEIYKLSVDKIEIIDNPRTLQQNKALHKYFTLLAE